MVAAKPRVEVLRFVQALYDYEAQQDGDLSFKEGDRIAVICDGMCVRACVRYLVYIYIHAISTLALV